MQIHIYALTQHRLSMDTRTLESIDRRLNFLLSSAVGHTDEGDDDTKEEKQVNSEDDDTEAEQQVNTAVRMFDKVCSDLLNNALHGRGRGSDREPMSTHAGPAIEKFLQTRPMADLSKQNKTKVCLQISKYYAQRYAEVRSCNDTDGYGQLELRTYHSLVNALQKLYLKLLEESG
jgi:hypothetical protein